MTNEMQQVKETLRQAVRRENMAVAFPSESNPLTPVIGVSIYLGEKEDGQLRINASITAETFEGSNEMLRMTISALVGFHTAPDGTQFTISFDAASGEKGFVANSQKERTSFIRYWEFDYRRA